MRLIFQIKSEQSSLSITMNTSSSSSSIFCRSNNPMLSSSFEKVPPIFKRRDILFFPAHDLKFKSLKVPICKCHTYTEYEIYKEFSFGPFAKPFSLIEDDDSSSIVAAGMWRNSNYSHKILGPGIILLKNYINLFGQVEIVNMCQKWGADTSGFYEPKNVNGKGLHMTCFGRNWDPNTKYMNPCRSDGSETPPIPKELISFTEDILMTHEVDLLLRLPSMRPDICVVTFLSLRGRRGLHQEDCDESSDSYDRGLPVVSISIGETAEFFYSHIGYDEDTLERVLLESGDVLIFGGESRDIVFGVERLLPGTCPRSLEQASRLYPGHLNLTLKQS